MADQMDLLVAGPDKHVLAAALRHNNASGATPLTPADLVGEGLRLRDFSNGDIVIWVPPEQLDLVAVDRRDDILLTPRQFMLIENLPEQCATPVAGLIALDGISITTTLPVPAPTPGGASVWVFIEGATQPIVQKVNVAGGQTVGSEPLQLPSGDYRVLALAAGLCAALSVQTVP